MEVYVKESLFVLDYNDKIKDTIFTSDDKNTPGYAYNINITEQNTGYSDLKFDMPNVIINAEGDKIKNPKLNLLTPLVKLRYRREVYYTGSKPITVREPSGYGDVTNYVNKTYSNTYPENLIEDYIMDYIVQPVDKKRDVLKLTTSFTAMDYPRFNLSKKRVGLTINDDTLTKDEWTLFQNKPLDVAGTIKYVEWTQEMSDAFKTTNIIPTEWNPLNATEYPLNKENIIKMMANVGIWPYGLLATAFYWPITETGRFKGVLYKKGGFLVLQLYDFYNLSTEGVDPDLYVDRYSWEWTQLYETDSYLSPNNALNYLQHILNGTNWSVAKKEDGTYDVDIVKKEVPNPAGSTTSTSLADSTSGLSISGSNCYNAITSVCTALQLYPIFDCVNRTVALRVFAGKNYGLVYSLGSNLSNNSTKLDGEKVITKLYVTGGQDYNGSSDINIGTAERTYTKYFTGFYSKASDLPKQSVEGYWAVVDDKFTNDDFTFVEHNEKLEEITVTGHDLRTNEYWIAGANRTVYFYDNQTNTWSPGTKLSTGLWSGTVNGVEYIVDPETGSQGEWDPNAEEYITSRSPYGVNYILNLKWAYQNNWITKEQILELYQIEHKIHVLDDMFVDPYNKDRLATQQAYEDAKNAYDLSQDKFESTLATMENKYYYDYDKISEGTVNAFQVAPLGTYEKYNSSLGKNTRYMKLFHCYNPECKRTVGIAPNGTSAGADITSCPVCGSKDVSNEEIYVPTYADYADELNKNNDFVEKFKLVAGVRYAEYAYNPKRKGDFLKLVTALDSMNNSWSIHDYEARVSLISSIQMDVSGQSSTLADGYDYTIDGVYVKSASGAIEVWNDDIKDYLDGYGSMLNDLRTLNASLERIKELQAIYDKWTELRDGYHAEIQKKFGDYIVEGNYTNKEQPYVSLLFLEGLEASDKYCIPEVTYNLNVIDATGLIEYRNPVATQYECAECGYISYHDYTTCPKCGESNVIVNHDTYNDLVHMLHSVGQIVPKAGDYVKVYDEPMGMFGVPALITQVSRTLDSPMSNKIQLDTSYTDDEELVGNIITATNTVLSNADIYARTAVLNSNGTIDSTSIRNSLDNVNGNISIVGTNGNVLLDSTGLRATDPNDNTHAMKYTGQGVFGTSNFSTEENEGTIWEKYLTPTGINANYVNAGTIDTQKINITSGLGSKVVLDQYGLSVKDTIAKSSHIVSFDKDAAKKDASYASKWGSDNNLASFIGVDPKNNAIIYTKGYLVAEEGSNIAGWITDSNSFYHLNGTTKDLWLSPEGINGTVNGSTDTFALYAKGNFGVSTNGKLYAKNANIQGKITSNDVDITGGKLTIGSNFSVDNNGNLTAVNMTANGGTFNNIAASGTITTTNLSASGTVNINDAIITKATLQECSISAGQINSGTLTSARIPNLSAGKITSGMLDIYNGTGFFRMGYNNSGWTDHPYVSALNIATQGSLLGGISFRTSNDRGSAGGQMGSIAMNNEKQMRIYSDGNLNFSAKAASFGCSLKSDSTITATGAGGYKIISANGNTYTGGGSKYSGGVCFRVQTTTGNSLYLYVYGGLIVGYGSSSSTLAGFTDISSAL